MHRLVSCRSSVRLSAPLKQASRYSWPKLYRFLAPRNCPAHARSFATHFGQDMSPQPNGVPLATTDHPQTYGSFDLVKRVKLDFTDVEISKWRSRKTGLSVVHLDYDGAAT